MYLSERTLRLYQRDPVHDVTLVTFELLTFRSHRRVVARDEAPREIPAILC